MFDEEQTSADDSQFSVGVVLTTSICILVAMLVIFSLYVGLSDLPFGTQIATAVTYSGVVYWTVFYKTRWFKKGFSFQDEGVKEKLPHLLGIHVVFLFLVLSAQTIVLVFKPRLPSYWFTEHGPKDTSLYVNSLLLLPILVGLLQVWISRSVLSRSVAAHQNTTIAAQQQVEKTSLDKGTSY